MSKIHMSEPKIIVETTTTVRRSVDLCHEQIEAILIEWARAHGFTHPKMDHWDGELNVEIYEEVVTTDGPNDLSSAAALP